MATRSLQIARASGFAAPFAGNILLQDGCLFLLESSGAALLENNPLLTPGIQLEDGGLLILETENRALQEA